MRKYLLILLGCSLLMSCSIHIEKRLYSKGYYVDITANNHIKSGKQGNAGSNDNLLNQNQLATNNSKTNTKIAIPKGSEIVKTDITADDNMLASVGTTQPIAWGAKNKITYPDDDIKTLASSKNKPDTVVLKPNIESKENKNNDLTLYALAALLGLVTFGLFRVGQRLSLNVTRWASKNKLKTKVLIALLQIGIGVLGVLTGKDFFKLGYNFSDSLEYIFGGLMGLGFLYLILNREKDSVMVLRSFYLRKFCHMVMVLSFFMLTIGIGNKLGDHRAQISPLGYVAEIADNTIYKQASPTLVNQVQKNDKEDCDVITLTNKLTIEVIIEEITATEVKYKKCNSPDGPSYKTPLSKIERIDLKNGDFFVPDKTAVKGTGWPGWYIAVYVLMCIVLTALICLAWCTTGAAAGIPVTIIGVALIVIVPVLMARRVRLGNIKR